jgi:DNA-binding transcriptional MerR regulator
MNELIKVRDVSLKYDISARALKYYEDMGLIESARGDDYAYRMYDAEAVKRLEQILILRKLNISIKDIQRIFKTAGSEVVLEVLNTKIENIDEEVALLHELKKILFGFIQHINQADFGKESDVKMLYEKAKEIETQITAADYKGNSANINRLAEITEKLDKKIPDIMVVNIPNFRAVTSGLASPDEVFGAFGPWQEAHNHLFTPVIFDCPDFLTGKDGKMEWFWAVKDDVTQKDAEPYKITEFQGGLYAVAVSVDGDGGSHNKVRAKVNRWLELTNFVEDKSRMKAGHMIYPSNSDIKCGLGYNQMNLYLPIKIK